VIGTVPDELLSADTGTATIFEFPAETAQLEAVTGFLNAHGLTAMLPQVAINELVVNAILHGAARTCRLSMERNSTGWCVSVMDDGRPFNPLEATAQPLGELREGGYGLQLMRAAAREWRYQHRNAWNELILHFEP
jgi:anti-sigma regulatory factor (Ser/Thr protein kinase)